MNGTVTPDEYSDVFIAHASEDKESIARPLSEALVAQGWSVWLDELRLKIGDSLSRHIDAALAGTRFGVVILSPHFFSKQWPQRELAGLAARELDSGSTLILPVWHEVDYSFIVKHSPVLADRLGVPTSSGIEAVCSEIASVLADNGAKEAEGLSGDRSETESDVMTDGTLMFEIPATDVQQHQLVEEQSDWWEYRLYAGVVLQGRIALEEKWQDHQLRLPRGTRRDIDEESFSESMSREFGWLRRQVSALDRVFAPEVTEKAFGPKGVSGDAMLIRRIAEGVIRIYEALMDWAAALRNTSVNDDYEEVVEVMARMVDGPVRQIRDFTRLVPDQIAQIPVFKKEAAEGGATVDSPAVLDLSLHISLDEGLQEELNAALLRAR